MERKKAFASASAATFVLGSVIVTAAAFGHVPLLGFGTHSVAQAATANVAAPTTVRPSTKQRVVVRTKDVYDQLVVDTGNIDAATRYPAPATNGSAPTPGLSPSTVAPVATPAPEPRHESDDEPGTPETAPPTTGAAPASPTTTLPTEPNTPTTQRLQIPGDWPAGTPIPPVPPNCFQPELRLNGTWNCQNDD